MERASVSRRPVRLVLLCLVAVSVAMTTVTGVSQGAAASPYRVTVIVSDAGALADRGALERRVAESWAARQRGRGGIFGRTVEVDVRSDGGSVDGAVRLAEIAIDLGAHAVVCCSAPAASVQVAQLAAQSRTPHLAPTGDLPDNGGWAHALAPNDATELQAIVRNAYARGLLDLGLMSLEGAFGDRARTLLNGFLAAPGLRIVGEARYRPDAGVLTPEALAVAVEEPHAVIVWGLRADSLIAVDGLRARGWNGPVYLRPDALSASAGGVPSGDLGDVRTVVSPASVPGTVPEGDEAGPWLSDARALGSGRLESRPLRADGARTHDALALLAIAFEQVATYGIDLGDTNSVRLALRDALIGLPTRTLAAGRYDLSEDDPIAARSDGLRAVLLEDGALRSLP